MTPAQLQVQLNLRRRGPGPCGEYSLSTLGPPCPVEEYAPPNDRLLYSSACSPPTGPRSWRYRWLFGPGVVPTWPE
jgi:hypothetical protein